MTVSKLMYAWCQLLTDSARRRRPGGGRHRFVYKYVGRRRPLASNGGFLNGRDRRLGPFSTAGARRLRAFVHYSVVLACIYNSVTLLPTRHGVPTEGQGIHGRAQRITHEGYRVTIAEIAGKRRQVTQV